MTEAEAITKWCPFTRVQLGDTAHSSNPPNSVNRSRAGLVVPDSCRCIASECAVWTWVNALKADGNCGLAHTERFQS